MQNKRFPGTGLILPLRVVRRGGTLWYFCADVCALLNLPPTAVRRLDREYTIRSRNEEGASMLLTNIQGVLSMITAGRARFSDNDTYVLLRPLDHKGGHVSETSLGWTDRTAALALAKLLLGLRQHAIIDPDPVDDKRRKKAAASCAIAGPPQREDEGERAVLEHGTSA